MPVIGGRKLLYLGYERGYYNKIHLSVKNIKVIKLLTAILTQTYIHSFLFCIDLGDCRYRGYRDRYGNHTIVFWLLLALRLGFVIAFEVTFLYYSDLLRVSAGGDLYINFL